jgi:phage-related holin
MNVKKIILAASFISLLIAEMLKSHLAYSLIAVSIIIGIDTLTGVIKAIKKRNLNSWDFSRLFKKVTYLYGAIAILLILYQSTSISYLRDFIDILVVLIIMNEMFSVMENLFEINEKTKDFVKRIIEILDLIKKK